MTQNEHREPAGLPTDPERRRLLLAAGALSLAASVGSAIAGEAPPAKKFRFGVIVSRGSYWNATQNFRNLLLDSDGEWQDLGTGGRPAKLEWGWPKAFPRGGSMVRLIRWSDQMHPSGLPGVVHIKPGNYIVRTRGGWSVNLRDPKGVTQVKPGRDLCTFTVPEAMKPYRIEVLLTNDARTPLDLGPGDLVICHVDDEAALKADPQAFTAEMLEDYRGFSILRNAEICGVNGGAPYTDAASIAPAAQYNGGVWPPELFAKLCKEVGAGMWINLPTAFDMVDADCKAGTQRMRLMRGNEVSPAPPNGAQLMWTRPDSLRPAGFDLGPYVVCNRNDADQTFQLADLATPQVPKRISADIPPDYRTNITRLYDWEALWRTYLERHHTVYPDPPVVRTEPFLEIWNPGYVGSQICATLGNYHRSGSRTGGERNDGQAFYILKSWRLVEEIFGKERHVRTAATFISAWVGSGLVDSVDSTGVIQRGAKLGTLLRSVAPATYYQASEPAKPALGTVDWFDPKLNLSVRMANGSIPENASLSRDAIIAEWRAKGPFSNARWAELMSQSFHYLHLNLRLWRDKMEGLGRKLGSDYDFVAYECGNHQRRDRPSPPQGRDIDTDIQDGFIAWNFGNSPEAKAFREAYRKLHADTGFSLAVYHNMAGDWFRSSQQVNQWGSLPWYGAEKTFPELRGWYDFLKANA